MDAAGLGKFSLGLKGAFSACGLRFTSVSELIITLSVFVATLYKKRAFFFLTKMFRVILRSLYLTNHIVRNAIFSIFCLVLNVLLGNDFAASYAYFHASHQQVQLVFRSLAYFFFRAQ